MVSKPWWVFALALAAAALHLAPSLRARVEAHAHPGWSFTGNLSTSPDYMQYRVWARRTQVTGPLVDNRFTAEPTPRYLPVLYYWVVGQAARAAGVTPEAANTALGAVMAFSLVLLIYAACRRFLEPRPAGWALLAIVLGGGLGAWLKLGNEVALAYPGAPLAAMIRSLDFSQVWENFRSHYVIKTLFDAHFLAIWLATTGAVLALHSALRRPTLARAAWAGIAAAAATTIHIYEGPLLICIAGCVALALRWKRIPPREWGPACAVVALGAAASVLAQLALFRRTGLPLPEWTPEPVHFSNVLLAYPLAWIAMLLGLAAWWRGADRDRGFLAAWAGACALLTLSGPYYIYASRGPMTWSIPLYAIAAMIWFERRGRFTPAAALAAILIAGATPYTELRFRWNNARFSAVQPQKFLGPEHRPIRDTLLARAGAEDVLLTDYVNYRWLAPEFPGRSWHGHFFNTPEFPAKRARMEHFFSGAGDQERTSFLKESRARFLFVPAEAKPGDFERLLGLKVLARNGVGTLFEVEPGGHDAR